MRYLGHLSRMDRLYDYLKYDIQPQFTNQSEVEYRVFRLTGSNDVFLYEEKFSGVRFVGKFFHSGYNQNHEAAYRHLCREYHHLNMLRSLGFDSDKCYVPRPLGSNALLNYLLLTEFCTGEMLGSVIVRAIQNNDDCLLYQKLSVLAFFLATLHNKTADWEQPVYFQKNMNYMNALIQALQRCGVEKNPGELYGLAHAWSCLPFMSMDASVLVHGDATPANFMCGVGDTLIALDLERLHRTDRVFDTGRIVGELAHFFMAHTGNRLNAERFIGHFLWEYASWFPDRKRAFESMNQRVPFYMGMTLLRIARNNWLDWKYRKRLVQEAKICLKGGLF